MEELHMLKAHYKDVPRVRLVVGNTSIGITKYFRNVEEDPKACQTRSIQRCAFYASDIEQLFSMPPCFPNT
jgi:hypothetical protein